MFYFSLEKMKTGWSSHYCFIRVTKIYLALFRGKFIFINILSVFPPWNICSNHLPGRWVFILFFRRDAFQLIDVGNYLYHIITHIFDCRLQSLKKNDGWYLIYLELILSKTIKIIFEMTLEANLLEKKCFIWKPIEVISTCQVIDSVLFFLLMCKEFFSSDLTEVMPSNRKDQLKFSIQG